MRALLVCVLLCLVYLLSGAPALADTADEIRTKIEEQQRKIAELEKEIAAYESTLGELGKNKATLTNEIARLDTSRKKLGADIRVTQDKITSANLEIERLGGEIGLRETSIAIGRRGIEQALRSLQRHGDLTLIEQYFSEDSVEGYWEDADLLQTLERTIRNEALQLALQKAELTVDRDEVATQRATLASLETQLKGQRVVLDQNRAEQNTLLSQTKQSESTYQKLLKEKQDAREQFERELLDYESQLKYTLDPSAIPSAGSGVLTFPLDSSFMSRCKDRVSSFKNQYCITQYFGNTSFARSGAYGGANHNGVDFGSPEGTKVVAASSGTVAATGNTDVYKGCYSYGKWVLLKHANGLATLYAHLSYIGVSEGQSVPVGGLLGYSGKTGYATGPHLHFTVFAADGVKIVRLGDIKAKTNCANALIPIAPTGAYLDPMSYL